MLTKLRQHPNNKVNSFVQELTYQLENLQRIYFSELNPHISRLCVLQLFLKILMLAVILSLGLNERSFHQFSQ